jgi:N-acyl homoserine lactone hydrolase
MGTSMTGKPLALMPQIDVLRLARVAGVPAFHPEHETFRPFPVFGFLIHHPDRAIVVDTGIGFGNAFIDAQYPHESMRLVDELNHCGVDERDVGLIINSHLHFDHCGQNASLACPICVQRAEVAASQAPLYTVPDWAAIPSARARVVDGDGEVAPGITVMLTPGHTPGHQAVVVRGADDVVVIAAQCVFRNSAWRSDPERTNLHEASWEPQARESIARLRALKPKRVLLSHDEPLTAPHSAP